MSKKKSGDLVNFEHSMHETLVNQMNHKQGNSYLTYSFLYNLCDLT